jgi:hypothetical protein
MARAEVAMTSESLNVTFLCLVVQVSRVSAREYGALKLYVFLLNLLSTLLSDNL